MDIYFELWMLIPSYFHLSMNAEEINEFSEKLRLFLNEEYYENFLSGITGLVWTSSEEICSCKS